MKDSELTTDDMLFEELSEVELEMHRVIVDIAPDRMSATVTLGKIDESDEYTFDEIMSVLSENNVKTGIDEATVRNIVFEREFGKKILVAIGKEMEPGEPGRYEFYFDTDKLNENKPTLREDGSVDYFNVKRFEKVEEGALLARYFEPTKGNFGFDVCGRLLVPKPGKPMPKLRGKGFKTSEDGKEFYATISGKIEYQNYDLNVISVYDVKGDLDLSIGNIDFNGDVSISGCVRSGVTVRAMGNIFVGGFVEGATLISKKDIVLQDGVNSKGTGKIQADGNISARFFENTNLIAKGDIKCSYLLNCDVLAYGYVYVESIRGSIIGGDVTGMLGVVTTSCGNPYYAKTIVRVGSTKEIRREYAELIMKLKDIDSQIETFDEALKKFELLKEAHSEKYDSEMVTRVFQSKIVKKAEKTKLEEESKDLFKLIRESEKSIVKISNTIYPGARVVMDDKTYAPSSEFNHIIVKKTPTAIVLRDYDDE